MSFPGQKQGSCGHVMALFDNHKKCTRCHEKGVGDDPCVKKQDCQICKAFMPAQIQQLATPTYKARKERGEQKKSEASSDVTPTLMDPSDVTLLGRVSTDKPSSVESTPKQKKKRSDGSPRSSKRNTAVNLLLMISSLLMTSVGFHFWKLCFLTSHLLF